MTACCRNACIVFAAAFLAFAPGLRAKAKGPEPLRTASSAVSREGPEQTSHRAISGGDLKVWPVVRPFPPYYSRPGVFLKAMEHAARHTHADTGASVHVKTVPDAPVHAETPGASFTGKRFITGLTLPHHLLAADLIARGFDGVRGQDIRRIVILSPDHYTRGTTPFSIPARDFYTCFGRVNLDRNAAEALLHSPLVSASNLFSHEHGVQALLPFVARTLPHATVLPIALRSGSSRQHWDALAGALLPLLDETTLIIQSTDFSHYLPQEQAHGNDRETLAAVLSKDPENMLGLTQPGHVDSKAALYLQMKLQKEARGATPELVAVRNSRAYVPAGDPEPASTTSYIVLIYYAPAPDVGGTGLRRTHPPAQ